MVGGTKETARVSTVEPSGDTAVTLTLAEMYRLIHAYPHDTDSLRLDSIPAVFDYLTSRVRFERDIDACGYAECLKRPAALVETGSGDCDDKVIFAAVAMTRIGVPWRIVLASYREDGELQHVYLEVFSAGNWLPFDPTYRENKLFEEKPYTRKVEGTELMRYYPYAVGQTLEGFLPILTPSPTPPIIPSPTPAPAPSPGDVLPNLDYSRLGPTATSWLQYGNDIGKTLFGTNFDLKKIGSDIAGKIFLALVPASAAVPVIGTVVAGAIAAILSLIGVKGPTQHLDTDQADAQARGIVNPLRDVYTSVPSDGKAKLLELSENFKAAMVRDFGRWWGGMDLGPGDDPALGFLNRYLAREEQLGHLATPEGRFYTNLYAPIYVVLRAADLESVKDNFKAWVIDPKLAPLVLNPLQVYVREKYNQIVAYNESGEVKTTAATSIQLAQLSPWLIAGGLLLFAWPKKRRV